MTTVEMQRLVRVVAAFAGAIGLVVAMTCGNTPARLGAAQKDKNAAVPTCRLKEKPTDAGKALPGTTACRKCHNGANEGDASEYITKYKSNEFVLFDEAVTWAQKDVH